jgi:hypothetical protein
MLTWKTAYMKSSPTSDDKTDPKAKLHLEATIQMMNIVSASFR